MSSKTFDELPLNGQKILLVEDCMDQSRLYLNLLINAGADVTLECNGMSGFETFMKKFESIELIIIDLDLPEMDGLQMTKLVRSSGFHTPIIGMTAYDRPGLESSWKQTGCNCFLRKPLTRDVLLKSAGSFISGAEYVAARQPIGQGVQSDFS